MRRCTGQGCEEPPLLFNEAPMINNWQSRVPGLWEMALLHNGTALPDGSYSRAAARWDAVHEAVDREGPSAKQ